MKRIYTIALFMALGGPFAWSADFYTDNVVIILDASGSMEERFAGEMKMNAAKKAIEEVLKTVPNTTQVGLLVFSGRGKADQWLHPLGPRDDAALLQALKPLRPAGSTPLGAYIQIGANRLLEERAKQLGYGSYRLLVVTDGQATDKELMAGVTPQVIGRGLIMDVIGVAMNERHMLAERAHSYRTAQDPTALKRAIAEVLGEVSSTDGNAAGADAFELLEGLPDEVAAGMLNALAVQNDKPVGFAKVTAQAKPGVKVTHRTPVRHRQKKKQNSPMFIFGILVLAYIGFNIIKKLGSDRH